MVDDDRIVIEPIRTPYRSMSDITLCLEARRRNVTCDIETFSDPAGSPGRAATIARLERDDLFQEILSKMR